jgi:hypothetical protein
VSPFANNGVLVAARTCVNAISLWLEQHGDRQWQPTKTEHDLALSKAILAILSRPETIAAETEWHCFINIIVSKSEDDEEWAQTTHWWELFVRADSIVCDEYYNYATIIGASQSYLRSIGSTEADTTKQRHELETWRAGYENALSRADVHVDVSSKKILS